MSLILSNTISLNTSHRAAAVAAAAHPVPALQYRSACQHQHPLLYLHSSTPCPSTAVPFSLPTPTPAATFTQQHTLSQHCSTVQPANTNTCCYIYTAAHPVPTLQHRSACQHQHLLLHLHSSTPCPSTTVPFSLPTPTPAATFTQQHTLSQHCSTVQPAKTNTCCYIYRQTRRNRVQKKHNVKTESEMLWEIRLSKLVCLT